MSDSKASGYISQLTFNNGQTIDIRKNDIVIFVGPNNAGKSQSLKDIYALSKEPTPSIVISDVQIKKKYGSVRAVLDGISPAQVSGSHSIYKLLNEQIGYSEPMEDVFKATKNLGFLHSAFVINLDTAARLNICQPPNSISRHEAKTHPIHFAAFNGEYRRWLSANFKKAFNYDLIPYTTNGATIPLCMGDPVTFSERYEDEQARQEAYSDILSTYKQVQNQGDGIKSFVGILLFLMLDYYHTYLIDEPESFLHPPQARIMGQIIGEALSDEQQAFISTHSEDIIKGLIETCPGRIKIIRITRDNDTNKFSVLNHDQFFAIWNDPLLRYSNIMSSLFHKTVVLCESDSDCRFYSIVESHLKHKAGRYSETLFVHCGGKHRMAKIITALRALDVNIKLISDIDVLNDKEVFKGIIEAFRMDWSTIERDYITLVSNLHSPKEQIERVSAKRCIDSVFNSSQGKYLSNNEISLIKEQVKTISKWKALKDAGSNALPRGDANIAFARINQLCKNNGIFIVTVGELECFVKAVGGHGPEWVNTVLESYPDLDADIYTDARDFISAMEL